MYVLADAIGGDVTATFSVGAATKTGHRARVAGARRAVVEPAEGVAPSLHEPFVPCGTATTCLEFDWASREWDPRTGRRPASTRFIRRSSSATRSRGSARIATIRTATSRTCRAMCSRTRLDLPAGTRASKLPNTRVRILAVSVADEADRATPAGPLYLPDFPGRAVHRNVNDRN